MTLAPALESSSLVAAFQRVRGRTEALASLLSPEDQQVQSMPDASPTKWHRAHTTWFFEQFLLGPRGTPPWDAQFSFLFNSYYDGVGARVPRAQRGLMTRPDGATVGQWRRQVDAAVTRLIEDADDEALSSIAPILRLGLAHEEQHQELIVTDALHLLSLHPSRPALQAPLPASPEAPLPASPEAPLPASPLRGKGPDSVSSLSVSSSSWLEHGGGLCTVGRDLAGDDLVFDNEGPAHQVFLRPFALGAHLVTVAALRAFIDEGGYRTPALWLAAGFDHVQHTGRQTPLYVRRRNDDGALLAFTVHGERLLHDDEPVTHLSYYEADALARFLGARLPTEAEWEVVAREVVKSDPAIVDVGFDVGFEIVDDTESGSFPRRGEAGRGASAGSFPRRGEAGRGAADVSSLLPRTTTTGDFFGTSWQWTQSSYQGYPGFQPAAGVVGEYNGKFMVNQQVLRGSSSYTPRGHSRVSYRNFWPTATSFQNTGLRLARG
jgi:ergothioneine biosynthesis protein EgtB